MCTSSMRTNSIETNGDMVITTRKRETTECQWIWREGRRERGRERERERERERDNSLGTPTTIVLRTASALPLMFRAGRICSLYRTLSVLIKYAPRPRISMDNYIDCERYNIVVFTQYHC